MPFVVTGGILPRVGRIWLFPRGRHAIRQAKPCRDQTRQAHLTSREVPLVTLTVLVAHIKTDGPAAPDAALAAPFKLPPPTPNITTLVFLGEAHPLAHARRSVAIGIGVQPARPARAEQRESVGGWNG